MKEAEDGMRWCEYGKHYVDQSQEDEETTVAVAEFMCRECAPKFWIEYERSVNSQIEFVAALEEFSTTGWVTCEACGEKITEGWQRGKLGQRHYCFEHFDKERS